MCDRTMREIFINHILWYQMTGDVRKLTHRQIFLQYRNSISVHVRLRSVELHDRSSSRQLRLRLSQVVAYHWVIASNANKRQQCRREIYLAGDRVKFRRCNRTAEYQGRYVKSLDRNNVRAVYA